MKELFQRFFKGVMPLERLELYLEFIGFCEDIGYTAPFEELQEIVELGTANLTIADVCSQVSTVIYVATEELAKAVAIVFERDASIAYRIETLIAVYRIEEYSTPFEVNAVIISDNDNVGKLANILCMINRTSIELHYENILEVDSSLIARIAQVLDTRSRAYEAEYFERPDNKERVLRLNTLFRFEGKEYGRLARDYVIAGGGIGVCDFETLVTLHIEHLTLSTGHDLAHDLLGLYLISKDPLTDMLKETTNTVGELTELEPISRVARMEIERLYKSAKISSDTI